MSSFFVFLLFPVVLSSSCSAGQLEMPDMCFLFHLERLVINKICPDAASILKGEKKSSLTVCVYLHLLAVLFFSQFFCYWAACLDFVHSSPCMETSTVNRDSASILLTANGKYRGDEIWKRFWKNTVGCWKEALGFHTTATPQTSHKHKFSCRLWSQCATFVNLFGAFVDFTLENLFSFTA